jgi:hypothetical protein
MASRAQRGNSRRGGKGGGSAKPSKTVGESLSSVAIAFVSVAFSIEVGRSSALQPLIVRSSFVMRSAALTVWVLALACWTGLVAVRGEECTALVKVGDQTLVTMPSGSRSTSSPSWTSLFLYSTSLLAVYSCCLRRAGCLRMPRPHVRTRNAMTQSQCTYLRRVSAPRFQWIQDGGDGCWVDDD